MPGQETQHPVDSLGRLARPAHVRPLRAFLILRIGEERLGGGSAVGVSRRAHQRGRHDGGEGSPRVTARAPLQKRREVGGPRPDPTQEPSARSGRSLQQVCDCSSPRVQTPLVPHAAVRAEVDVAQKLGGDADGEHRVLVLLLRGPDASRATSVFLHRIPLGARARLVHRRARSAPFAPPLRLTRSAPPGVRGIHEPLHEGEVLPAEEVTVEHELQVLGHHVAANLPGHIRRRRYALDSLRQGVASRVPRRDRRLSKRGSRRPGRRHRRHTLSIRRFDPLVEEHVRAVGPVVLGQPAALPRNVVVVRGSVQISRHVVVGSRKLRHVHRVLAPEGVRLEVGDVVRLHALVVVHVPSRADAVLRRVRTGRRASLANVRVVVPGECRSRVHDDPHQPVPVVVGPEG